MKRDNTILEVRGRRLALGSRTWLMGILNVTPDSFSDAGQYLDRGRAIERGLELEAEGADIIDVGGESTRPGANPVPEAEELGRVIPVIKGIRKHSGVLISVDTMKASVARAAVDEGADIVNDVSAMTADPGMAAAVAAGRAVVVLMHMKGTPGTMQSREPSYGDVVAEVRSYLAARLEAAVGAGVPLERTVVDPGLGFGKTVGHNLALLHEQTAFLGLGRPLLMGFSRKSFIGAVLGRPAGDRLEGTLAAAVLSVNLGAHILRVHDVAEVAGAVRMAEAILGTGGAERGPAGPGARGEAACVR